MRAEAPRECQICPRLVAFRADNKTANPAWFNGAVPSFGEKDACLLIVGLAPGLQGANKTGRPFTGDYAGDLLYATMLKFGFAKGTYAAHPDDGLALARAMITNAVRCVPPENKPIGAEQKACRPFLEGRIASLPHLKAVLCLGKIAHDNAVSAFGLKRAAVPFGHARYVDVEGPNGPVRMFDSYHCSRYNTNTGRLTTEMFEDVFSSIKDYLAN